MGNKSPCGAGIAAATQGTAKKPEKGDARQKTRMKSKYVISNQADDDDDGKPEEHLEDHKDGEKMSAEVKELVIKGLKADPLCAMLEDAEINYVLQSMQHFSFRQNDQIVKQGETGTTFFVLEDGTCSVSVNGKLSNTLSRGNTFGGVALRYRCPRTASVICSSPKASCWGANGDSFHKALASAAKGQYQNHRKILDGIQLFEGLSSKQKDIIAEGIFSQKFEGGQRVVTEKEAGTGIFYVKSGTLSAYRGAKVAANGSISGGAKEAVFREGDLIGEQALVNGKPNALTVVSDAVVEVLTISTQHLTDVVGKNIGVELEKSFLLRVLRQSQTVKELTGDQQKKIVEAMKVQSLQLGEKIPEGLRFVVVIQGSLSGTSAGKPAVLNRGQFYENESSDNLMLAQPAAKSDGCKVAMVDRDGFRQALRPALVAPSKSKGDLDAEDYTSKIAMIKGVHVFRQLSHEQTDMLVRAFKVTTYNKGDSIIKQGDTGKEFFVVQSGEVEAYVMEGKNRKVLRTMVKNASFGERSLLLGEPRSATVEVMSQKAEIGSLAEEAFIQIVKGKMKTQLAERVKLLDKGMTMKDLKCTKVIGVGATGTVRLVQHKTTKTRYALKRVKKKRGKVPKEVEHERTLLKENDHPFIMYMVTTFETAKSVYMLTELNTGGELHAAIRKLPAFLPLAMAQFYTGTIALVLEELSERNIVYRDLKPENVMLDAQGYLKLVDFGIAKKLDEKNNQTFTIIGTPHYMAPEVLLGRGYGLEVDIWSMGILLYEFVCGRLPFADDRDDPSEVCQAVLKATLNFPHRYKDAKGQSLIKGLLCRQRKKRCGAGISGFDEIKKHDWFKQNVSGDIFEKILGRELDAPYVPKSENYADPQDLVDVTLSDAGELG